MNPVAKQLEKNRLNSVYQRWMFMEQGTERVILIRLPESPPSFGHISCYASVLNAVTVDSDTKQFVSDD